jgi:hypothetical protein
LEQTVEVVRNDTDGPRTRRSNLVPKEVPLLKHFRERTTDPLNGGGAIFENPMRERPDRPGTDHELFVRDL